MEFWGIVFQEWVLEGEQSVRKKWHHTFPKKSHHNQDSIDRNAMQVHRLHALVHFHPKSSNHNVYNQRPYFHSNAWNQVHQVHDRSPKFKNFGILLKRLNTWWCQDRSGISHRFRSLVGWVMIPSSLHIFMICLSFPMESTLGGRPFTVIIPRA